MAGIIVDLETCDNQVVLLDSESHRVREIYALFGLAMYNVQCFERTLSMLKVTVYNSKINTLNKSQFDSSLESVFKKTLGQLISELRKTVEFPEEFDSILSDSLKKRNWLAHNYFWERSVKFLSKDGQEEMIEELRKMSEYFENIDHTLDTVLRKWMSAKGISEDSIKQNFDKLFSGEIEWYST